MTTDVEFDHHSVEYSENWPRVNAEFREKCPVAHTSAHGGFYIATSYAAVERIVKDDATFSSRHDVEDPTSPFQGITVPAPPVRTIPIEMDPPEFTYFRKALNPWFAPGATRRYEPFLRSATTALIDTFIEKGSCDLVDDLFSPLPAILTAKLLGLPLEDWKLYSEAAHNVVAFRAGTPEFDKAAGDFFAIVIKSFETAVLRRVEPKDDLISMFVGLEENGEPLSDARVMEMSALIIAGGNDTTTSLLANASHWLEEHPDQKQWLMEDTSRLDSACEEMLRYFTPTQILARTVTCPVEVEGTKLEPGDRVMMSFSGANRDPAVFEDPDEMKLDRFPNRHQAFGLGIHRCLGSNFTRLEFRVVFEELFRRLPDLVVHGSQGRRYDSVATVNGWASLPATFTPGPVEGSDFEL